MVSTLVLMGSPVMAYAAWSTSGSGASYSRAGSLGSLSNVTTVNPRCSADGTTAYTDVTWTASAGADRYEVNYASNIFFTNSTTVTTTATTATISMPAGVLNEFDVRARARAGTNWVGSYATPSFIRYVTC